MGIQIRPFRLSDQEVVKKLILEGLGEHFGRINPGLNPDLNDIYDAYIRAGHYFVVAEIKGEVVGTAALMTETKEVGRIVRVTVSPEQRRAGIGRQLIQHLMSEAAEKKFSRVLVETNHNWYDAIRLYERCGFKEYDRDDESIHLSLSLT